MDFSLILSMKNELDEKDRMIDQLTRDLRNTRHGLQCLFDALTDMDQQLAGMYVVRPPEAKVSTQHPDLN